jgi:hypothetical protein
MVAAMPARAWRRAPQSRSIMAMAEYHLVK